MASLKSITLVLWRAETTGSLGLVAHKSSSRFNEKPCLKGTRERIIEPLHIYAFTQLCSYTIHVHHINTHIATTTRIKLN